MTIDLPEDLERFIQSQVDSGVFASQDEAIVEAVRRLSRSDPDPGSQNPPDEPASGLVPTWKRVLETMNDVPDDVLDQVPADSSEQLDHYLYGTPRRPTP